VLELLNEVLNRLKNLESKLIVKTGKVVSVNPEKATVRVEIRDIDQKVSYEMPVVYHRTVKDKTYYMPEVGEEVICVFVNETEGFVLGSVYHEENTPPASDKNLFVYEFEDGTKIAYDKNSGKLTVENPKEVILKVQNTINEETQTLSIKADASANLDTPTFTITGNVIIEGNLMVMGNINSIGQTTAQGGLKTSPQGMAVFVDDLITKYNTHTHAGGNPPDNQLP